MKKLLTLLLALVMVVGVLAACNDSSNAPETTKKPTDSQKDPNATQGGDGTPGATDPVDTTPVEQKLNIDLEGLDYGNREFYIYHWSTSSPEFDVDEEAQEGDPIQEALYQRNLKLEEGLGIKLNFHGETGGAGDESSFTDKLATRVQDPETPVDLVASYSRAAPFVLVEGLAVDLLSYTTDLDLSKVWWPVLVREEHEIKGRLFYTSGDASTGLLTQMETLFMNKRVFESRGGDYEQFMKDVKNGKWTLDDLIELTTGTYQDVDDIPGESNGDTFGIMANNVNFGDGMWTAYGYTLFDVSSADDSVYELSDDLLGENAQSFVKKMTDFCATNDAHLQHENAQDLMSAADITAHFAADKTLFIQMRIGNFDSSLVETAYTILPLPKGSDTQERYYTCVGNPYSLYSICSVSTDKDLVAQVLQTMGYYGYTYTTPAIFEVTFKGKVAKDDHAIEMFDILRESITFDVGRTFDRITGTMLPNLVSRAWVDGQPWSSALTATKKKVLSQSMTAANKKILAILEVTE